MTPKPDSRWEAAASREPYFSILTAGKFRTVNLTPAHEREFFDSGETFVESAFRVIEARFIPQFTPASVLEYGCGVGRLAIPLARRVASVTAVDRSPTMLDLARGQAKQRGIENIGFQTPAELFATKRKFDLVTCYLLFQRMPQDEGLALLRQLLGCLGSRGIGVFHFQYRITVPPLVTASRWLRERVPALNGIANLLGGKAFSEPFIANHTYDLDEVFRVLREGSIDAQHVIFERSEGLISALVFVEAPLSFTPLGGELASPSATEGHAGDVTRDHPLIDVRQLIADTPIDVLNRKAEDYFAGLTDWEHHLSKPFSSLEETPQLLLNAGTLLQALQLTPGSTVLDFGSGTGWLSRFLTQLGFRVILVDVSETALRMARELYERQPIIGNRPAPQFVRFDGLHINLPDKSVERIVSFDAFHHVPNPDAVLREFGRILKPGGLAGFIEPGPRHSRSSMSQFEMRTYGVVENDVDVHAIWRTAQTCGFSDMKLVVFHNPPFYASLEGYEDLLAGGPTSERWLTSTRGFLRHVRSFVLTKEGSERLDSRTANGLACDIRASVRAPALEGEEILVDATVTNTGTAIWLSADAHVGSVALAVHLYDASNALLRFDYHWQRLADEAHEIAPGETIKCHFGLSALTAGSYVLEFDCVAREVTWFSQAGSHPETVAIQVGARPTPR
jgi:ubiquinone/menaquinone biosynthesis C-methylase UbiE